MMSYSNESEEYAGIDYTQLEKYLKAGMWKMADLETRKLICVASGLSPADQKNTPSLNQLPCSDLQMIDQLWVKYSKGRFGFSVQRPLWATLEKKFYSKTDAWGAFGDRVGWRINHLLKRNHWKPHKELNFTLDAPVGHLPHMGDRFGILTLEAFAKQLEWCSSAPPEE